MSRKTETQGKTVNKEASEETSGAAPFFTRPWPLVALGVAAASGVGLVAATVIGVGEAAIAGAAGYLAYRRMTGEPIAEPEAETEHRAEVAGRKRQRAA